MCIAFDCMLYTYVMSDPLQQLFSNQARAEIFKILFDGRKQHFHLRELVRRSGLALRTIQSETKKLRELDLLRSKQDGNRLDLSANDHHPLYQELCNIVSKTSGYIGILKREFAQLPIETAFVFGSMAIGKSNSRSDIDLIIIGDAGLRRLAPILRKVSVEVGREINPHVYTEDTWKTKLAHKEHFVTRVTREKKLFLIGDEDVLRNLG